MQLRRFRSNAILLLWLFMVLPACSTAPQSSAPPISSTRGTTLVRMATITEVRPLPSAEGATAGQQVSVQFDDGQIARYEVSILPPLRPGERIIVSEMRGRVSIAR